MNYGRTRSRLWPAVAGVMCAVLAVLLAGCSGSGSKAPSSDTSGPRELTSTEAQQFAVMRFNAYQAKTRSFDATIISAHDTVLLRGWINTAEHEGYGLATPTERGAAFLTFWTTTEISAGAYAGPTAPLPIPNTGWQTTELKASDSVLAAAQLLLISLSSDRPDNPQLLLQGTAQWLRNDTIGGQSVSVVSGPVSAEATTSNLRYWIDEQGRLLRLQARLDGAQWSMFNFADTPDVSF